MLSVEDLVMSETPQTNIFFHPPPKSRNTSTIFLEQKPLLDESFSRFNYSVISGFPVITQNRPSYETDTIGITINQTFTRFCLTGVITNQKFKRFCSTGVTINHTFAQFCLTGVTINQKFKRFCFTGVTVNQRLTRFCLLGLLSTIKSTRFCFHSNQGISNVFCRARVGEGRH